MKPDNIKRKLLKDRNFPGPGQINKYQDFDRVLNDYGVVKKLMLKKAFLWTGAAIGSAAIAGAAFFGITNSHTTGIKETRASKAPIEAYVQPPIPGKEVPYAVYRISSRDGGVLNFATGSSLSIPPDAFYHPRGEKVSDSVEIKYREFHDPLDIFLSGVPMEYDSAGVVRTLESAGMLEILANDERGPLNLDPQKPVEIRMASLNNDERFNLYELDAAKKTWVYKGKDLVEKPEAPQVKRSSGKGHGKKADVYKTIRPVLADPQRYKFSIAYDKKDFPELEAYDNVQFEVTGNNFKPAYYKISWKKITVQCGAADGLYEVKLVKADTTITVEARPVFEKENYEAALKRFEERRSAAAKITETKELREQKEIEKVNSGLRSYSSRDFVDAAFVNAGVSLSFRRFAISSLGYHNVDFPVPSVLSYAYNLVRAVGSTPRQTSPLTRSYNDIYVVVKGKNTVFRFRRGEPVRCRPDTKNLMWTLNDKGQVAFFRIQDYSRLVNGGDNAVEPVVQPDQDLAFQEIRNFSGNVN